MKLKWSTNSNQFANWSTNSAFIAATKFCAGSLCVAFLLVSCATPSSPTGGPPDKEPPRLIRIYPTSGTTNFNEKTFEFTFNEYVNRQTLQRALSIEPDINIPYTIDWKRTTATVRLQESLPDNTTIIVTLGTELTDFRSNKLKEPIQVALSTGPTISKGEIRVRVANYQDGSTQEGRTVFLFKLEEEGIPFDPTAPPLYVSQTDTAGVAKFIALADGRYRPMWVEDRNRSRTWQPDRETAQPFDTQSINIVQGSIRNLHGEPDSSYVPQVWIYQPDTTSPILQSVGVISERRLRLRFSEPMYVEPGVKLNLYPVTGAIPETEHIQEQELIPYTQAIPMYILPEDSTIIVAQSTSALPEDSTFWLSQVIPDPESVMYDTIPVAFDDSTLLAPFSTKSSSYPQIKDTSGNPWPSSKSPTSTSPLFKGSSLSDQADFKVIGTSLTETLYTLTTDSLSIAYNFLIEPSLTDLRIASFVQLVLDSTMVIWNNQLIPLQQLVSEKHISILKRDNRLMISHESKNWPANPSPVIQLFDPISQSRTSLTPKFIDPEQFGLLEITVITSDSTEKFESDEHPKHLVIQLENEQKKQSWSEVIPLDKKSTIVETKSLPPGTYLLRYFIDDNQNNRWDYGDVIQHTLPEVMNVIKSVEITNGFTGQVKITIP